MVLTPGTVSERPREFHAVGCAGVLEAEHHHLTARHRHFLLIRQQDRTCQLDIGAWPADDDDAFVRQLSPAEARIEQADADQGLLRILHRVLAYLQPQGGVVFTRHDIQRVVINEPAEPKRLRQTVKKLDAVARLETSLGHDVVRQTIGQADAVHAPEFLEHVLQRHPAGINGESGVFPACRNRGHYSTGPQQRHANDGRAQQAHGGVP